MKCARNILNRIGVTRLYGRVRFVIMLIMLSRLVVLDVQADNPLPDSTARRLISSNRYYIDLLPSKTREYRTIIPLIENYGRIVDLKLKGEAAYILGHYFRCVFEGESSLKYLSESAELYARANQWGLYLNSMKDLCNVSRMTGNSAVVEPLLKKCLESAKKHHVGFYVLDPLEELTVHLSYTDGNYAEALKYGHMFMDTLEKYKRMHIKDPDFERSQSLDASVVELELGHSYLALHALGEAEYHLRRAETFFLQQTNNEKLARVYRHLAVLSAYQNRSDSAVRHLNKFDQYSIAHNRARASVLFNLPKLTRELETLNKAYLESKEDVRDLTMQNYYSSSFFVLALVLTSVHFWTQRKSKRRQKKINELLTRDFERVQQLNDEKTRYFSILSHELRTPIFAITGLANLLDDPVYNTKENIDAIINSGNHLLHLVNNVLQHNKLEESGDVMLDEVNFELQQTLTEVLKTTSYLASQKNIGVVFYNHLDGPQHLRGDRQKLAQILVNLISNAIRYSGRDSKVEVSVMVTKSSESTKSFHFGIQDHGIGIDSKQIPLLFDYRKTNYDPKSEGDEYLKGIGIGLFVVGNFIAAMGSRIQIESEPGNGANFYFELTFSRAASVNSAIDVAQPKQKDANILVIDDTKNNLIVTQKILNSIGLNCFTASDTSPVVEMIREKNIDLVLVDLNMKAISGYDLARKIRNAGLLIPIIAHTAAFAESIDKEALHNAGMDDYLIKPYSIEKLRGKLAQHLDKRPASDT
jgi:signal transduction histidine kinase/ActR/RegA family two-component response regulator